MVEFSRDLLRDEGRAFDSLPEPYPLAAQLGVQLPRGHFCMVYQDAQEHLRAATAFLSGGVAAGDACVYTVSERDLPAFREALAAVGLDVHGLQQRDMLTLMAVEDMSPGGGAFDPEVAVSAIFDAIDDALEAGAPGVRLGGDMGWALEQEIPVAFLATYEALMDARLHSYADATILCAYDARGMSSRDAWGILMNHAHILYGGGLHENALYGQAVVEDGEHVVEPDPRAWLQMLEDQSSRRRRHAFLARVLEHSAQPVAVGTVKGTTVLTNDAFDALVEDEVERDPCFLSRLFRELAVALEAGESTRQVREIRSGGEGNIPIEILAHAIRDASGSIVYVSVFASDIRREHAAVRALERERDFIRRLMETSPSGITVVDASGRISYANPGAREILGLGEEEIESRSYDDRRWESTDFEGNPIRPDRRIFRQVMDTGQAVYDFEERIVGQDGSQRYLRINGTPLRDDSGTIEGAVFSLHDVTTIWQAEYYRERKLALLSELAECSDLEEACERVLREVLEVSQADAGGIRFLRDGDYAYLVHHGFPPSFVRSESHLMALDEEGRPLRDSRGRPTLECLCGEAIRGGPGDSLLGVECEREREGGFLYIPDTEAWIQSLVACEEDSTRTYRGRCYHEGYRSIALVPIDRAPEPLGLIQLNDRESDAFDEQVLEYIEDLAGPVGYLLRDLQSREQTRISEDRYRNLVERASDTIVIIQDYAVRFANSRVEELLGYTPEEIVGTEFLRHVYYEDLPEVVKRYNRRMSGDDEARIYRTRLRHRDGHLVHVEINAGIVTFEDRPADMIIVRDVSERIESEERLRYLSMHDPLTGLYNRAFFEEELRRLDVPRQLPLTVVIGDLNGLKMVNDAFGHGEGDRLLRFVADKLREHFRDEDVVARWGGDEYIVILPQTDRATAEKICERLQQAFHGSDGSTIAVTISLGTATKEKPEEDIEGILRLAEQRMYRNKTAETRQVRRIMVASLEESVRNNTAESAKHVRHVGELALALGDAIGVSAEVSENLLRLAEAHDIGYVALDSRMLLRAGALDEEEWAAVRAHPVIGYRIAQAAPDLWSIADAILAHHESWDGSGYPRGLCGKEIPLEARILAIVDAYDVMVTGRPYRRACGHEAALEELRNGAGTQFDPHLVEVFVELLENGGLRERVYG